MIQFFNGKYELFDEASKFGTLVKMKSEISLKKRDLATLRFGNIHLLMELVLVRGTVQYNRNYNLHFMDQEQKLDKRKIQRVLEIQKDSEANVLSLAELEEGW